MILRLKTLAVSARARLGALVLGPQVLSFFPAVVLAAFWLGGEGYLLATALGLPLLYAALGLMGTKQSRHTRANDAGKDSAVAERFERTLAETCDAAIRQGRKTGCILLALDDADELENRYGQAATEGVLTRTMARISSTLRERDRVFRLDHNRIGIVLAPVPYLDLNAGIQLVERLQSSAEEPIALDATTIYVSVTVGMCLSTRAPGQEGGQLLDGASLALEEALRHAPSAVRSYSRDMKHVHVRQHGSAPELCAALENGQIQPWFQPQISTDTGRVTGFEALARWTHPNHGVVSPAEFLPAIQSAGQTERLGEVMLYHSLNALQSWDRQGLDVPHIGVNFTPEELRNPKLVEKIAWELDRFELSPDRLAVEILENVVADSPDDVIARNINGLSELGCRVDLDDFGTGHASISSIRRFAIQRLKIDRSFVIKVDRDPEQQRMVSAILLMAERLDLDTLAEGVETAGEHAMLAQLGCRHVQGFGIGRPMPFAQTAQWIEAHLAKLSAPPEFRRKIG